MSCNSDYTFSSISYVDVSKYNKPEKCKVIFFSLKKYSLRTDWNSRFDSNFSDWMLNSAINLSQISKLIFNWVVHIYALSIHRGNLAS